MTTTAKKWPDEKLEAVMIADAELSFDPDVPCHVKALLSRVRTLEEELAVCEEQLSVATDRAQSWKNIAEARQLEVERLHRYEQAMQSMADQICSPKTTAEEMVAQILGEPGRTKKASR